MRVPIACTLTATDATDRVGKWRTFLAGAVVTTQRPEPTTLRWQLREGDDVLLAAADLCRREQTCCAFFRFRLEPTATALWLDVEVPEDAVGILDDFASLAPTP